MKRGLRLLTVVLLGLLLVCLAAGGFGALSNLFLPKSPAAQDRLDSLDKARLAEAIHLRQALGEQVWSGFGQARIPLIVWNKEYSFLIGAASAPHAWEAVPEDDFQGQPYYRQVSNDPQNFTVALDGDWAASIASKSETDAFMIEMFHDVLPPLIENIFPYRLLIQPSEVQISATAHESFHVFQQQQAPVRLAAAEIAHRSGETYWQADLAMRADWQAEIDLLYRAARAPSDGQAKKLARQFLTQRQARRSQADLPLELVDYERQLEWEEGLAKYIELAIWQAAYQDKTYQPTLSGDPDFKRYATFPKKLKQELDQMKRQATQDREVRFYYTGMAMARLLERFDPAWKDRALQEGAWLEDLLNEAVR